MKRVTAKEIIRRASKRHGLPKVVKIQFKAGQVFSLNPLVVRRGASSFVEETIARARRGR